MSKDNKVKATNSRKRRKHQLIGLYWNKEQIYKTKNIYNGNTSEENKMKVTNSYI